MTLHTKLCDLLGVTHPIMLAGMGGVSYAELVAAVSQRRRLWRAGHGRARARTSSASRCAR